MSILVTGELGFIESNFVRYLVEDIGIDASEITVVDDIFMSPTYTKDVAVMLKKFLVMKPEFGVYHMANDGYCSWFDFKREISHILGWDVHITPIKSSDLKRLARRPIFSALENTKLEELGLGMMTWKGALKDCLKEEKIYK